MSARVISPHGPRRYADDDRYMQAAKGIRRRCRCGCWRWATHQGYQADGCALIHGCRWLVGLWLRDPAALARVAALVDLGDEP